MSMKCCHCAWHNEDHMSGPGLAAGTTEVWEPRRGLSSPYFIPTSMLVGRDGMGMCPVSGAGWECWGHLRSPSAAIAPGSPSFPASFPCSLPIFIISPLTHLC